MGVGPQCGAQAELPGGTLRGFLKRQYRRLNTLLRGRVATKLSSLSLQMRRARRVHIVEDRFNRVAKSLSHISDRFGGLERKCDLAFESRAQVMVRLIRPLSDSDEVLF